MFPLALKPATKPRVASLEAGLVLLAAEGSIIWPILTPARTRAARIRRRGHPWIAYRRSGAFLSHSQRSTRAHDAPRLLDVGWLEALAGVSVWPRCASSGRDGACMPAPLRRMGVDAQRRPGHRPFQSTLATHPPEEACDFSFARIRPTTLLGRRHSQGVFDHWFPPVDGARSALIGALRPGACSP
jgi:hypothetical protein